MLACEQAIQLASADLLVLCRLGCLVFLNVNSSEHIDTLLRSIHCPVQVLHFEDSPGSHEWRPLLHFVTHCPHPDQVLTMLLQLSLLQLNVGIFALRLPSVPLVFLSLCIPLLLFVIDIIRLLLLMAMHVPKPVHMTVTGCGLCSSVCCTVAIVPAAVTG